jgi:hypothetical protein
MEQGALQKHSLSRSERFALCSLLFFGSPLDRRGVIIFPLTVNNAGYRDTQAARFLELIIAQGFFSILA